MSDRINVEKKIELKELNKNNTSLEWFDLFQYNKKIIGHVAVRLDVYHDFIKVLCIYPLKGKKLKYFLKLKPTQKTGYMSKYIMKIARQVGVPQAVIENFHHIKEMSKLFKPEKSAEEVGQLYRDDIKEFLNEYGNSIKSSSYDRQLSQMTNILCSSIFEQYDKSN